MAYGAIPEQFRDVDLDERRTWPRATMREWLDHRFHLLARREDLRKEPGEPPLSEWDYKFLHVTEWLEEALAAYYKSLGAHSTMGILFNWLATIEDEQELATKRSEKRKRYRDSVAIASGRRLKSNRNPFYPRPPELIHIDGVCLIIVSNILRDFDIYLADGDPFAEPKEKGDIELHEFITRNPTKRRIVRFTNFLKRYGYVLHCDIEDVLTWSGWRTAGCETPKTTSRNLMGLLFNIGVRTIRRDLSKSKLSAWYRRYSVPTRYQHFVEKKTIPGSASILRSGWYTRVTNGEISIFDTGPVYSLLPVYRDLNT